MTRVELAGTITGNVSEIKFRVKRISSLFWNELLRKTIEHQKTKQLVRAIVVQTRLQLT